MDILITFTLLVLSPYDVFPFASCSSKGTCSSTTQGMPTYPRKKKRQRPSPTLQYVSELYLNHSFISPLTWHYA